MKLEDIYSKNEKLMNHKCKTISSDLLHLPSRDAIDLFTQSDRSNQVVRNLNSIYAHGRLDSTG